VGRSNVGKSSLINALTRRRVARTSAAPGKTRLANIYRVQRGSNPPLYLVDLPGYGYARGGSASASEFEALTAAYFAVRPKAEAPAALLLVDARHPGLASDLAAWHWLRETVADAGVVATKIDKLARGERIRAMRELESVLEHSVLPVSAVTGEGLEELWKWMDRPANSRNPQPPRKSPVSSRPPKEMAQPRQARSQAEGGRRSHPRR
jgi:GTP-binding protein